MDSYEFTVPYSISDYVSASLAHRKANGDHKTFIIISWVITILGLMSSCPGFLIQLMCIPTNSCFSENFLGITKLLLFLIGCCGIILTLAYTNILYRIRIEIAYRLMFKRSGQDTKEPVRVILSDEGLEIFSKDYKHVFFWNSITKIHENDKVIVISMGIKNFIPIPKRPFKSDEISLQTVREIISNQTGKEIISI